MEYLLVFSNLFITPTIIHLYKNKSKYFFEIFNFVFILFISSIYHACFIFSCEKSYYYLWTWDRILALQSVTTCMMFVLPFTILKCIVWIFQFLFNILVMYYKPEEIFHFLLTSIILNLSVIVYHFKIISRERLYFFFKKQIDSKYFILTLICVNIALLFFYFANNYVREYTILHSFWHFFIFLSTYLSLFIKRKGNFDYLIRNISMDNFANFPKIY